MLQMCRFSILLSLLSLPSLGIAASVTASLQFVPADPGRTHMDRGGTWNGTAEVTATTGDTFRATFQNAAGSGSAFDFAAKLNIMPNFALVPSTVTATVSGAGCGSAPGVSGTRVGNDIVISFSPSGYDLPDDCELTIDYGVYATGATTIGQKTIKSLYQYANVDGGSLVSEKNAKVDVEVLNGISTITKTPAIQDKAVGDTAAWTVEVCNSGFGGLFDVQIDESAMNPNPAGSLQATTMTQSAPAVPAATLTAPFVKTLPYLAPGQCYSEAVEATVTGCNLIDNEVATNDRLAETAGSILASVKLDLMSPLADYTLPVISVPSSGTTRVSIPITNISTGTISNLQMNMLMDLTGLTVSNVDSNWTYDSGTQIFSYVGGAFAGSAMETLEFDLQKQIACPIALASGGLYSFIAVYNDDCGNPFEVPTKVESFSIAGPPEPVEFEKGPDSGALTSYDPGDTAAFTLSVTPTAEVITLSQDVVITDTLPASFINYVIGTPPTGTSISCTGACQGGDTLTWTLPEAVVKSAPGTMTLDINFDIPDDTQDCNARNESNFATADFGIVSCAASIAGEGRVLINNTAGGNFESIGYNIANTPINGSTFETGTTDANTNLVRDVGLGEGEFIQWSAHLETSKPDYTFSGSSFSDDLASSANINFLTGSLEVVLSGANSANPGIYSVPAGSITSSNPLVVDLGFLNGASYHGTDNMQDTRTEFQYTTIVSDAHLAGNVYREVFSQGIWDINGFVDCQGAGGTVDTIKQFHVARRSTATVLQIPPAMEICGVHDVTIFESAPGAGAIGNMYDHPWHPKYTVTNGVYSVDGGQTPTYTGDFSGNTTFGTTATNTTFDVGPENLAITTDSSTVFQVGIPATSSTTPSDLCVSTEFDSTEGLSLPAKNNTRPATCKKPAVVLEGDLQVFVNPQSIQILPGQQVAFDVVVTNAGSGTAYNSVVTDVIPAGLVPNLPASNAVSDFPATLAGQTYTWNVGSIGPGASVTLGVVLDENVTSCSDIIGQNNITARWGCGGVDHQTATSTAPDFKFVDANLTAIHRNTTQPIQMCSVTGNSVEIEVKNAGLASVEGVIVKESFDFSTTSVAYLAGSTEFSIDNGSSWSTGLDPSGTGDVADPLVWDQTKIAAFSSLDPAGGTKDKILIRYKTTGQELITTTSPAYTSSVEGTLFCGDATTSPASSLPAVVHAPDMFVTKTGRNVTNGESAFSSSVGGAPGDVIEWRFQIQNTGQVDALAMLMTDNFANSSGSQTGSLTGPGHSGTAISDGVSFGINDVGTLNTYLIQETLGATCLNAPNVASIEWGCSIGSANRLTAPTRSSHSANLVMIPAFGGSGNINQVFNYLPGGRAEVAITVNNTTTTASNLTLTDTLPAGYEIDTTFSPTIAGDIATLATNSSNPAVPVFTFGGESFVDNESFTVTFRIKQTASFDTTEERFTNPETVASGFDPALPTDANNQVAFEFSGPCAGPFLANDSELLEVQTPDLDIASVTPVSELVSAGAVANAVWTFTNNGDAGSLGTNGEIFVEVGNGWTGQTVTVSTPAPANAPFGAGTGGACVVDSSTATTTTYRCSTGQIGAVAVGDSVVVQMAGTAADNGNPLNAEATVVGNLHNDDGSDSSDNYSLDTSKIRYIGMTSSKVFLSSSETFTTDPSVAIGEELTYRLSFSIFGLDGSDPASQATNITVRDTLPDGLGYVSHIDSAGHDWTYAFTSPAVGTDDTQLDFDLDHILNPNTDASFVVDLVTRVLNTPTTLAGPDLTNNFGVEFDMLGSTFASDNADDTFGGSEPSLHDEHTTSVLVPEITFDKLVRNVTSSGSFAATASAVAGDELEYQITLNNSGDAPLFDIDITDLLPTGLVLQDGSSDGVDNDGDGSADPADTDEGAYVTGTGSATFDAANTNIPAGSPEKSFAQLDPGETITVLLRGDVGIGVTPADVLDNDANASGNTLPGASGSQTGTPGASGDPSGEAVFSATDKASINIEDIQFNKTIVTTSVNGDTSADVVVGETITYRLSAVLPEGTSPNFSFIDDLPLNVKLAATNTPVIGSAVSGCAPGGTTVTPSGLPSAGPTTMTYAFGPSDCVGAIGSSDADRTVTVDYDAIVINRSENANGVSFDNVARYEFDGFVSPDSSITTTVREPILTVDKVFKSQTVANAAIGLQAGDTVTYTITVQNNGAADAYDLVILDESHEELENATAAANPDSPGAPVNDGTSSGVTTWRWNVDGPLAQGGASYSFDVTMTLGADIQPSETLSNGANVTWTSTPDDSNSEERNGDDGIGGTLNDHAAEDSTPVSITVGGPDFNKTIKAPGLTNYAVGEDVVYVLESNLPASEINNLRIQDSLPAGLIYKSASVSSANLQQIGGGAVSITSAPAANATGPLEFEFGNVENSAANPSITLEVTARVANVVSNQVGTTLQNGGAVVYEDPNNPASDISVIEDSPPTVTVVEPNLTIDKVFKSQTLADASKGLQAGDTVTYTISIANNGNAPAYDLVIEDLADENLITPLVAANPDTPGAPTNSGTVSGVTTWDWSVDGPLAPTATYAFDIIFTLDSDVSPAEVLTNNTEVTWTSTESDSNPDERGGDDGAGGTLDDYESSDATPVSVSVGNIQFSKDLKTTQTDYAVGDDLVYVLQAELPGSQVDDVRFQDTLPTGMSYISHTFTATNLQAVGGGAVALASGPAANATGAIEFDFGDVQNSGVNPVLALEVTVRVLDVGTNIDGTALINAGAVSFDDPENPGTDLTIQETDDPQIDVVEPALVVALDGPAAVSPGVPANYTANVENDGESIAWQPTIEVELPVGMRGVDPTTLPYSLEIQGGRGIPLVEGTDYTITWDGASKAIIELIGANGFIDAQSAGEMLVFDYQSIPDNDLTIGTSLQQVGSSTQYHSTDNETTPSDRDYDQVFGSGTLSTANATKGDDEHDEHTAIVKAPIIAITKAVSAITAMPGDTLDYTVTITNTGDADGLVNSIVDEMDANFVSGTMTTPVVAGGTGANTVAQNNASGGVSSTGIWEAQDMIVPHSGGSVTITFSIDLAPVLPDGTVLFNQAVAEVTGVTEDVFSDSNNPADDDGVDSADAGTDPDDDDPTQTVIQSGPNIVHQKVSDHSGDGSVETGDEIEYTITVQNLGNENTNSTILQDAIPGNTTYVPGSTTINGVTEADVGGASPLVAGVEIESVGSAPAGWLYVGETATITFKVTVNDPLANGTVINNQAIVNTVGEGSGPYAPIPSDDPESGVADDPTTDVVGSYASLVSQKTVVDLNMGTLVGGDVIEYTITIRNEGTQDATGVVFTDVLPTSDTVYNANSVQYDDDGVIGANSFVAVTDSPDADIVDVAGATVTANIGTIPAGGESAFKLRMTVSSPVPDGTVISNQGTIASNELPDVLTDVDGDPDNGSNPTDIVTGSEPLLVQYKTVTDINGGILMPGEDLLYTITTKNIGAVDATNVVVTDTSVPPASTTYVAGSTAVSGSSAIANGAIADAGASSALNAGINVGTIAPGSFVINSLKVNVDAAAADGTTILNQASFAADGGLAGISDSGNDDSAETGNDPSNPIDDDPTVIQVGGADDLARIGGSVWFDDNHDNIFDATEAPLDGWIVEILNGGNLVDTVITDANGYYEFNGLPPGSGYEIQFRHPTTGVVYGGTASTDFNDGTGGIDGITLQPGFTNLGENLPVDPSGVFYDSITRNPVSGVNLEIVDANGNPYDADCFLPGQQNQTTGADGRYRFDVVMPCTSIAAAGTNTFCIQAAAPSLYLPVDNSVSPTVTSTIIPGQPGVFDPTTVPTDPIVMSPSNGAPQGATGLTYHTCFEVSPGTPDIINNHIPLDPVLEDAFAVTKTTPMLNVTKGTIVPYTIRFKNQLAGAISGVDLQDILPPGFIYQANSALINGVASEPTQSGGVLTWPGQSFAVQEEKVIDLLLTVGIGVTEGEYVNQAYVFQPDANARVSNLAKASVIVVPDPILDCPEIIGQVFDDTNQNGFQDKGEKGIAGVEIVTARGWVIRSDEHGRYHVACPAVPDAAIGSNFVLKVNPRSLPTGYRMTTSNPGILRLTRGKMSKLNFGAHIHKVVRVFASDDAFSSDKKLKEKFQKQLKNSLKAIEAQPNLVRIALRTNRDQDRANEQLETLKDHVSRLMDSGNRNNREKVQFEEEIHFVDSKTRETGDVLINDEYPILLGESMKIHDFEQRRKNSGGKIAQIQCQASAPPPTVNVVKETTLIKRGDKPYKKYVMNFKVLYATLDQEKVNDFKRFIAEVKNAGEIDRFEIVGHTDSDRIRGGATAKFQDNWELSRYRAKLAKDAIQKVFPSIAMTEKGMAATMPVVPNNSKANKAKNRRTEVWVYLKDVEKVSERVVTSNAPSGCSGDDCFDQKDTFRVTVDGQNYSGTEYKYVGTPDHVDFQRCTDVALEKADIAVHFDAMKVDKILGSVGTSTVVAPNRESLVHVYSNYDHYVKLYEVRIFEVGSSLESKPTVTIGKGTTDHLRAIRMSAKGLELEPGSYIYVVRAYDQKGNYDETLPQSFRVIEDELDDEKQYPFTHGYGANQIEISGIHTPGGAVTVSGTGVPSHKTVRVMGLEVPMDKDGQFLTQQILPHKPVHGVQVEVKDASGKGMAFRRDLKVPRSDWFMFGLADLTVGQNDATGDVEVLGDNHRYDDEMYVDGRIAFYLKGKIKGQYILTASLDTTEGELDTIFSSLADHRTKDLFKRIDPDQYYPVYGDESTLTEDAPTKGKFYVKIEADNSHILWGNFKTDMNDSENFRYNRGFYGAQAVYRSKNQVENGEHQTDVRLFAAEPGTLQSYEEFRGTGGSVYVLRNFMIDAGSEKVRVEVRDINSDLVLKSRTLQIGTDYEMSYANGKITLTSPLPSYADQSPLVQAGSLSGNKVFLIVNYEHSPLFTSVNHMAMGGRARHWFGDHVRLGVAGWQQKEGSNEHTAESIDIKLRKDSRTYLSAEIGRTEGGQVDQLRSLDGGFGFDTSSTSALPADQKALAIYGEFSLGLYQGKGGYGKLTGYYDSRERGFSVPSRLAQNDIEAYGAEAKLPITRKFQLFLKHDFKNEGNRLERTQSEINASLGTKYKLDLGVKLDNKKDLSSGLFTQIDGYGERVDGQLRFTYKPDKNSYYAYHQQTLANDDSRLENTRTGIGLDILARKNMKVQAEVSVGDGGVGAKLGSSYEYDERFSTYQNYLIENNNAASTIDGGLHASRKFVHGVRQKFSDTKSIFYENQATDRVGATQGLSHSFGFDYKPEKYWNFSVQGDFGRVSSDDGASETKRKGATVGVGYTSKATKLTQSVEYRRDENEPSGEERDTITSKTRFKHVVNEEWTLFAKADLLESKSSRGTYYDGNYKDFTLGMAFRPTDRDWWNSILKLGYYEMLPSAGKVDAYDLTPDYRQRKLQVNFDNSFQLSKRFELGLKLGYAQRQLQFNRQKTGKWFDSDVMLGVIRLDVQVAKTWYAFGEYRMLAMLSPGDQNLGGALIGVYKQILSDNRLRIGVGYNFSSFSDDLSDTKYDAQGWFLNVTAAF